MRRTLCAAVLVGLIVSVSAQAAEPEAVYRHFVDLFASQAEVIPPEVEVLGVKWDEKHLILNVSAHIMAYGGNANERALVDLLLETAASFADAEEFTLLIAGELQPLPEGRVVDRMPTAP